VSLGGEPNGDGFIDAQKLIKIIRDDFEMTIDIEKLINDIDEDGSGEIEYDEFRNLLSSSD
jgi:Ca2+-binding EF-hand superfamily protein